MTLTLRTVFPLVFATLALIAGLAAGCGGDHDHTMQAGLAAPTSLEGMVMNGGVHLTWEDNSGDEDGFMIMRRTAGTPYASVGRAGPDATSFHDRTVSAGRTYSYLVHAFVANASSSPSNELSIAVP